MARNFKIKGSRAVLIGREAEDPNEMPVFDKYRQGVYIRSMRDLTEHAFRKLRPNSGFVMTFDGVDIPRNVFDDRITPTMGAANLSAEGRLSERLVHEAEERDLGQLDVSSTPSPGLRVDITSARNPVSLLTASSNLILAEEITNKVRAEDVDGRLDIFRVRESIVLRNTDPAITSWAGTGLTHDGRSIHTETGHNLEERDRRNHELLGASWFTDLTVIFKRPTKDPNFAGIIELQTRVTPWNDQLGLIGDHLGNPETIPSTMSSFKAYLDETAAIDNAQEWDIMGNVGWSRENYSSVNSLNYHEMHRG